MFTVLPGTDPIEFLGLESWIERRLYNADSVLSIIRLKNKYSITDTSNRYGFNTGSQLKWDTQTILYRLIQWSPNHQSFMFHVWKMLVIFESLFRIISNFLILLWLI